MANLVTFPFQRFVPPSKEEKNLNSVYLHKELTCKTSSFRFPNASTATRSHLMIVFLVISTRGCTGMIAFWSVLVSANYANCRQTSEAVLFWLLAGIFSPSSACSSSLTSLLSLKIKCITILLHV